MEHIKTYFWDRLLDILTENLKKKSQYFKILEKWKFHLRLLNAEDSKRYHHGKVCQGSVRLGREVAFTVSSAQCAAGLSKHMLRGSPTWTEMSEHNLCQHVIVYMIHISWHRHSCLLFKDKYSAEWPCELTGVSGSEVALGEPLSREQFSTSTAALRVPQL